MQRIYNLNLPVLPFVIAPVAQQNIEAAVLMGPSSLAKNSGEVVDLLHGPISRIPIKSLMLAQIQRFRGSILASTTFKTGVPDAQSRRRGLKITLGIFIQPDAFRCHGDVTTASLFLLDALVSRIVSVNLHDGGTDHLASLLQRPTIDLDQVFRDTGILLAWFEETFCITAKQRASVAERIGLAYRIYRLLSKPRICPASSLVAVLRFWWYVDQRLHSPRKSEPSIRPPLQLDVLEGECPLLHLLNHLPEEPQGAVPWHKSQRKRTEESGIERGNKLHAS